MGEIDLRPLDVAATLHNVACLCHRSKQSIRRKEESKGEKKRRRTRDAALCYVCELPLAQDLGFFSISEAAILVFSLTTPLAAASRQQMPISLPPVAGASPQLSRNDSRGEEAGVGRMHFVIKTWRAAVWVGTLCRMG